MQLVELKPFDPRQAAAAHRERSARLGRLGEAARRTEERRILAAAEAPFFIHPPPVLPAVTIVWPPAPTVPWWHPAFIGPRPRPRTTSMEILRAVAAHHRLQVRDLLSHRRLQVYVRPRQIACYLMYRMISGTSMPRIGRILGDRDHTTVLHAIHKIRRLLMSGDPATMETIRAIKHSLGVKE